VKPPRDGGSGCPWLGGLPHRPELIARYGYDVKYASHALRLAYQGHELAGTARLTLPMPDPERERVLRVKRGEVPDLDQVLDEIAAVQRDIETLLDDDRTPLPEQPDGTAIDHWSVDAHRRQWSWT
jgi:hypothetical protein